MKEGCRRRRRKVFSSSVTPMARSALYREVDIKYAYKDVHCDVVHSLYVVDADDWLHSNLFIVNHHNTNL